MPGDLVALVAFGGVVAVVAVAGLVIGRLLARPLDRWVARRDEEDEGDPRG